MSLMLKLLITTLLLSSAVFATNTENETKESIKHFLQKSFGGNRNIVSLKVKVGDAIKLKEIKGWSAYVVDIDAMVKSRPTNRRVKQKMFWYSNGDYITQDFIDAKTSKSIQELIRPKFQAKYYKKENLLFGDVDAKHKVVIFSDPLCPFCRAFVPGVLEEMKKYPKTFVVYYYHLPLSTIHPASLPLVKAAFAAQLAGVDNVVLNLYKVKVSPIEKDTTKILKAFNDVMKTDIKLQDLNSSEVLKHYKADTSVADELMIQGTPTMYYDGKIDRSKSKYKKAIKKDG